MTQEQHCHTVAADQRRYFNRVADMFDAPQPPEVMHRLREVVAAAQVLPGASVLDIGTGAGVLLPLIEPYHPSRMIGVDLSEQMLIHVHSRYPSALLTQGDVVRLPLKAGAVDIVFMNAMYGNIADKPTACANVARVLRPGGRLVISHPEGRGFIDKLRAALDLFIEPFPGEDDLRALLRPLGLDLVMFRDEPKLYLAIALKR